jgi:predicted RNA polymerase sigma factor
VLELSPSPVVALNRVVAVAKVKGAEQALSDLRSLGHDPSLQGYHLLPAVEGRLLHEIGDNKGGC